MVEISEFQQAKTYGYLLSLKSSISLKLAIIIKVLAGNRLTGTLTSKVVLSLQFIIYI